MSSHPSIDATSTAPKPPDASVVIVTKNRINDLRRALASVFAQRGSASFDVTAYDDASTDGTPDVVQAEFPQVRLHVAETSTGHIVHRNAGTFGAAAPVVIIIDDDAELVSTDVIERTVASFDHPAIAAVAIPFINNGETEVRQRAPDEARCWCTFKFIGAAHALRRDAFTKVGGYRTELVHFGEEADLCARLLEAGYVTRLGNGTPARHHLSPIRNRAWEHYYAVRSGIVASYMNYPARLVVPGLAGWTAHQLLVIPKHRRVWGTLKGLGGGYRDILKNFTKRRGIRWPVHKVLSDMKRHGPMPLEDVKHRLPHVVG